MGIRTCALRKIKKDAEATSAHVITAIILDQKQKHAIGLARHGNMDEINIEQTIGEVGTKSINIGSGGSQSDVQAGIEFIYHMREHLLDIGIATIYGFIVYAAFLYITKKIKG